MAHVNTCLKRIFTIFNVIFAVIGILIIILAAVAQMYTRDETEMENRTQGLIGLYTVGILTTVIAIMGAYGAHKENKGALVAFLVCMVIGGLLMLRTGVNTTLARPGMENLLETLLRQYVPLDYQPDSVKDRVETLQYAASCCGLFSDEDWKTIPASCQCERLEIGTCKSVYRQKQTGFSYRHYPNMEEQIVYSQPCFPIVSYYFQLVTDVEIAVVFTLAALALLGTGLSSFMIHQLNQRIRPTVLLTTSAIFNPQSPKYRELESEPNLPKYQDLQNQPSPPKYQELQNLPKYEEVQNAGP